MRYAIELPDGSLYPRRRWKTAESAGRYLASAEHIKCGAVVEVE
jgi:hypothetical protein